MFFLLSIFLLIFTREIHFVSRRRGSAFFSGICTSDFFGLLDGERKKEREKICPRHASRSERKKKRERQVSHKGRKEKWLVDFFPRGEIARAGKVKVAREELKSVFFLFPSAAPHDMLLPLPLLFLQRVDCSPSPRPPLFPSSRTALKSRSLLRGR